MRGVSLSDDASLAGEWLEIYATAAPSFLVVQKADGDGVDADAVAAVSYTHLDVYKRQPLCTDRLAASANSVLGRTPMP